jgi:hypothetical protein
MKMAPALSGAFLMEGKQNGRLQENSILHAGSNPGIFRRDPGNGGRAAGAGNNVLIFQNIVII